MKRYLYLFCQIIVILFFISCEKKDIIKLKDSEKVQFSSAKKSFESDFSDFDFNKYNIEPIWSQAIELPGRVLEVPFKVKNKTFRPKLDSYQSRNNEASARLILYKESGITVVKIIYYFPGVNFKGNLDEINAHTIKSLKFSGLYMHQKLGESETHIRFTEEGKITDRKTGTKDEAKKNGRVMACQLWGMFYERYNEFGQLVEYELLWTWNVCDGGDPTEDQAPPGDSGVSYQLYTDLNTALLHIKNNLKKPCYINAFNLILNNSQSINYIQTIFNNYYSSLIYNFTIDEVYDNYSNYKDAPGKYENGTVYLNDYSLEYSSQEMIVATILHEMLHVHILTSGTEDHNTMSTKYVQPFAEALRSIFPSLSQSHATALAWAGLQGTNAWGQLGAFQDPILDDIYKYWNFRNSNPQRYGTQQFGTPCL